MVIVLIREFHQRFSQVVKILLETLLLERRSSARFGWVRGHEINDARVGLKDIWRKRSRPMARYETYCE
jgi:hypothetical protein